MSKIIINKFFFLILIISSLCFASTPNTLKNQKNKPLSEFHHGFKEVEKCKIEYLYDFEGITTFSKNYGRNSKLISKTSYRSYLEEDTFIFHEECFNEDCYPKK
jgi:hypothetical protein